MYVYARINKETMKFIRETKAITLLFLKCISCFLMGQQRNLLPFLMVTTLWGLVPMGLS